jgi:hypothetical protein
MTTRQRRALLEEEARQRREAAEEDDSAKGGEREERAVEQTRPWSPSSPSESREGELGSRSASVHGSGHAPTKHREGKLGLQLTKTLGVSQCPEGYTSLTIGQEGELGSHSASLHGSGHAPRGHREGELGSHSASLHGSVHAPTETREGKLGLQTPETLSACQFPARDTTLEDSQEGEFGSQKACMHGIGHPQEEGYTSTHDRDGDHWSQNAGLLGTSYSRRETDTIAGQLWQALSQIAEKLGMSPPRRKRYGLITVQEGDQGSQNAGLLGNQQIPLDLSARHPEGAYSQEQVQEGEHGSQGQRHNTDLPQTERGLAPGGGVIGGPGPRVGLTVQQTPN